MRTANLDLVERLKDERAYNLQKRAADYAVTEVDQLSQRFREAMRTDSQSHCRDLTWRGATIHVSYSTEMGGSRLRPVYLLESIHDLEWMDVADQVTSSELDDLERQLFNLDNLARCGL